MQNARFKVGGKTRHGALEGAVVVEYSGTPFTLFRRGRRRYPLKQTVLLAPVVPSKIVAVGLNYRDHAKEMNLPIPDEPRIFLKPATAVIGPGDPRVRRPRRAAGGEQGEPVDHSRPGRSSEPRLRGATHGAHRPRGPR